MTPEEELRHLRQQVTDLQRRGTELLTENRALRGACEVRFTLAPGATAPTRGSAGAAGWDLYAPRAGDQAVPSGRVVVIHVGVCVELPPFHEAQVRGRSSMVKRGLLAVLGTIDADYRGAIGVALHNVSPDFQVIKAGERIAQLVVSQVPPLPWVQTDSLSETERGARGWGSTGR